MKELTPLEKNKIFSNKVIQKVPNPEIPKMIQELVWKSERILDLGCGDGEFIKEILKKYSRKKITGVDISPSRIARLKQEFPSIDLLCEDILKNSLKKEQFDLIICSQVIEHIQNEEEIIQEFNRLLRKGGYLYVTSVLKKPWAVYKYRNNGKFVLDPTHEREYASEEEFRKNIEKHFKLLKVNIFPTRRKIIFKVKIPGYFIIESLWKKE